MIRASICILLVVASALFAVPLAPQSSPAIISALPSFDPYHFDPNGTQYAFNSTVANLDIYTHLNATVGGNCSFGTSCNITWFNSLNSTVTELPIPETGFHFNLTGPSLRETVNYTLNVPKGTGASTYLRFEWNGTVGTGTGARYLVSNSTSATNADSSKIKTSVFRPATANQTGTFFGSNSTGPNGGSPLSCGRNDECFDITSLVGYNITLTFLFNSTSAAATGHLRVSARNIEVVSMGASSPAPSHSMNVDTNPAQIDHDARLVVSYNSTVSYKSHLNQTLVHRWSTTLLSFYSPAAYTSEIFTLGINQINSPAFLSNHLFAQGPCTTQGLVHCTAVQFFSVNVTDLAPSTSQDVLVKAQSNNALASLTTGLGPVDTNYWTPGENITVRVRNTPGVNVTGTQVGLLEPVPSLGPAPPNVTLSPTAPVGSANYTMEIPTTANPLGSWILTVTFLNGYDFGIKTHNITIDELQVNSGSSTNGGVGSSSSIAISGKISYLSNPASQPINCNVGIFAIGKGTGLLTSSVPSNAGLYISNITSVVGVGSPQQPIIMYFTLVNRNASIKYDANVTIDHEWYPGATHGVNVTIPLVPGSIDNGNDFEFTPLTYSLQALVTPNGVQLTLQSLATKSTVVVHMTPGDQESGVPFLRQHFGQFKITLHAKDKTNHVLESPLPYAESPPYAYLLYTPVLPGQLLGSSSTTTSTDGSFSASLDSNQLVGVKNLRIIVLARDSNGVVLGDAEKDPTIFSDSTSLTPTGDIPSSASVRESVTATLHVKSNATTLVTKIIVNLNVTGPSIVPTQTKTITIQPGGTSDATFTIPALAKTGVYTVTFWTPQYGRTGAPLLSRTLVVSVISTTLQIIVLPAIGIAVAAIIVIVYTRRKQPSGEQETTEKTKTRSTGSTRKADSQPRNP